MSIQNYSLDETCALSDSLKNNLAIMAVSTIGVFLGGIMLFYTILVAFTVQKRELFHLNFRLILLNLAVAMALHAISKVISRVSFY